jgi:hypothetical protein
MPDWSKEVRAAIARLNMDPAREAELVEELSQHSPTDTTSCDAMVSTIQRPADCSRRNSTTTNWLRS